MDKQQIYETLNRAYFSEQCHEKEVVRNIGKLLQPRGLFVDVGASLGQFTYFANQCLQNGEIIAVEADPIRFEELQRNCAEWEAESSNRITAIHAAVCETNGEKTFFSTMSQVSGGLTPRTTVPHSVQWTEVTVPCTTIDSLLEGKDPDLIKIDVEGAEMDVLLGAEQVLNRGTASFLIEIHSGVDETIVSSPQQVRPLMRKKHYFEQPFHGRQLFVPASKMGLRARTFSSLKSSIRNLLSSVRR